jgi:hypothetical protein
LFASGIGRIGSHRFQQRESQTRLKSGAPSAFHRSGFMRRSLFLSIRRDVQMLDLIAGVLLEEGI